MFWLPLLAGAGFLKSQLADKPKADRERMVQSETTRYSPWTHMQAPAPHEADPFGSALSWGMTGGMLDQSLENTSLRQKYNEALINNLNAGSLSMSMGGSGMGARGALSGYNYGSSPRTFWDMEE